jgi:hypothetical protein
MVRKPEGQKAPRNIVIKVLVSEHEHAVIAQRAQAMSGTTLSGFMRVMALCARAPLGVDLSTEQEPKK